MADPAHRDPGGVTLALLAQRVIDVHMPVGGVLGAEVPADPIEHRQLVGRRDQGAVLDLAVGYPPSAASRAATSLATVL